ncbi:hypothetical protein BG011_007731 [Mortierella polycephala]|uniref:Amino acid transporter transmembrane domain-containing protein n=1 Tax=Mortierella polycephala TaxID=41804 RepID=A0A9P6PRG2_9FUNG|nr:hypothetical protein BG011_007731 [Mortierella polycephala]
MDTHNQQHSSERDIAMVEANTSHVIETDINTINTNGYPPYSMAESDNESGSDTTALQSNQHVPRTNSSNKDMRILQSENNTRQELDPDLILESKRYSSSTVGGADGDNESDVDLDFGFDSRDFHESQTKVPLVKYNQQKKNKGSSGRSNTRAAQPKNRGEYGRISHDSFHSGQDDDDDDDGNLDFGQEEEGVGMMTGTRSNRSGIGNGNGNGSDHHHVDAKLPGEGGSLFSSFLNMANSIIGAGIIGLPFAFQEAGLGMGIILLCFLTWIVDWTVRLLVHSAKLSGRATYQDLLMFCFGKMGLIMISIFQFIFAFGAMCAYTVIVGDTLPHVLQALIPGIETSPLGFLAKRSFVITFCTVLISLPLSLYRDISKLAKTSAVAMLALVVIIIAVLIEGPRAPMEIRGDPNAVWSFARPEVFQSIGVISFAFVCHHNSFLIFGSLQKPTINRVSLVTHISMIVSLLACLILALSGFLIFSDKTQAFKLHTSNLALHWYCTSFVGNILNNFPSDNFIINIARFCFGVNMFTTLPLEAFVIEAYYFPGKPFSMKRHFIITTGLVGIALLIALLTCDLGFVLEVTGGFSATALAFILPPLCYLKLSSGPIWSVKKIPYLVCVGFGIAVMILSTFFSLQHFMAPNDPDAAKCSM